MYKFLIVDDEVDSLNLIAEMILLSHYQSIVLKAENALSAFEIAIKQLPDLIITDWELINSCGIELLKQLKTEPITQHIPVVIVTGRMTSAEQLKMAFDCGAADYIRKPIDCTELNARIDSILRFRDIQQQIIEAKNKEIALHSLFLHHKNEFENKIHDQLQGLADNLSSSDSSTFDLVSTIASSLKNSPYKYTWKDLELNLEHLQPGFTQKLARKFPNLSPSETRFCVFFSLNMDTKAIANILHISPDSVKVARKRLRKKLGLATDENLISVLQAL